MWRRMRAALQMGLLWGAGWAAFGFVPRWVFGIESDLPFAFIFAPLGFLTGVVFSGVLVAIERRRGAEGTSLPRFAAWGASSGMLLTGIFTAAAAIQGRNWVGELLLFGAPLTLAGAVCAAGSLALARKAEQRQLAGDKAPSSLAP